MALVPLAATTAKADPSGEYGYYNGQTVFFASAATKIGAQPSLLEAASKIYLVTFPTAPGTEGPITLPSGYQPQENGNMFVPYPWHDHVLPAVPGPGYSPAMQVVILRYTEAYAASLTFTPVTSLAEIEAGKRAGIFEVLSPGAADPYELLLPDVLIRPVVRF
jgi:hypothetical protein